MAYEWDCFGTNFDSTKLMGKLKEKVRAKKLALKIISDKHEDSTKIITQRDKK